MQKLSACRKRGSSIHFFSSTIIRCIMAIWPAGPPKLMQPILSQTLKNSPKSGRPSPTTGDGAADCAGIRFMSSRRLGRPVVAFLRGEAQPREQRIVDHEAVPQQAVIVVARERR